MQTSYVFEVEVNVRGKDMNENRTKMNLHYFPRKRFYSGFYMPVASVNTCNKVN